MQGLWFFNYVATLVRRATQPSSEPGQAARLDRLNTGKWTHELLKNLEWRRLEELCAAYFEELGFRTGLTHDRADGAVDISLYAAGAETACILVHCKAWGAYPIGLKPLQELRGAMSLASVAEGVMVAAGRFTPEAKGYAAKESIELIDGAALLEKLAALPPEKALALLAFATAGDFLTPTCPRCSIKMTARKSTREGRMFWGCTNYPRCKQTFSSATISPV
ncbi:MAG TPA: restriction endonuclease [Burkholderiales bacterium]|nr:restriction endonuclease [Burkholderiales bacterium]